MNTDYKILAKNHALRLKRVLLKIIDRDQVSFMKERPIPALLRDDIIDFKRTKDTEDILIVFDYIKKSNLLTSCQSNALRNHLNNLALERIVAFDQPLLRSFTVAIKNVRMILRDIVE